MNSFEDKVVCITQPEHMPWLGYIDKMYQSDVLIFLDNVSFKKRHFENRNKIRTLSPDGFTWLTVPVLTKGSYNQHIDAVKIDYSFNWRDKYLKTIQYTYKKAKYFNDYYPKIEQIFMKEYDLLVDLNIDIIKYLSCCFGMEKVFLRASDITDEGKGSERILAILKKVGARTYFSGRYGGLNIELLENNGIHVIVQDFQHPRYIEMHEPFYEAMSCIDLLFNYGGASKDFFKKQK